MATRDTFYIVDRDLNKLGQIDQYKKLKYVIKSYDFNEFTLEIPTDSIDGAKLRDRLDEEFYLVNINNPEETCYVALKSKVLSGQDKNIVLEGYGPKYRFLKKRTILEGILTGDIITSRTFENIEADLIAVTLIDENCINASDVKRNYPNFEIPGFAPESKTLSRSYIAEELFEELKKLMIDGEFVIKIIPDLATKKWNISIEYGEDKTGSPSKVVFSEGSKNINGNELVVDDSQFANLVVAFSEKDFEGKITEVGDIVASGFDRYETPLFSNELEDTKIVDDANARLAETQSFLTVNARVVNVGSNYIYKRDYDLFDLVIYKDNDTGVRSEERIINITKVYEENKAADIVLDFGFTKTTTKEQNRDVTNRLKVIERKLVGGAAMPLDVNIVGQDIIVRTEDERNKIKPIAISKMSKLEYEDNTVASAAENTYTVTLEAGSIGNFSVGNFVTVFSIADNRFYQGKVISIAGDTLTLDTLLDFSYPANSIITAGSTNLGVDGSGGNRPVIFGVRNTVDRIATIYDITRIIMTFNLTDTGKFDEFGNLPALEYGLACRRVDTITTNYWNVKSNKEIASILYDFQLIDAVNFGQGGAGSFARLTFEKLGSPVRLEADDDFQILVQDDLTGLDLFEITVEGFLIFPEE